MVSMAQIDDGGSGKILGGAVRAAEGPCAGGVLLLFRGRVLTPVIPRHRSWPWGREKTGG